MTLPCASCSEFSVMRNDICVTNCGAGLGASWASLLVTTLPPPSLLPVLPVTWSVPKPSLAHIFVNFAVLSTNIGLCGAAAASCAAQARWQHYKPPDLGCSCFASLPITSCHIQRKIIPSMQILNLYFPFAWAHLWDIQSASSSQCCEALQLRTTVVGFGCLRTHLRDQQVSCRLGSRRGFLVGPLERRSKSSRVGCFWGY